MKKMTKLYQAGGTTSPESSKKKTRKRVIKKQKLQEGIAKKFGKEIEDLGYKKGGSIKRKSLMMKDGGSTGFEKRQQKKIAKAQTRATVAQIEGEGTVANKRDNRAKRVSQVLGTARAKTPKSVSTSTSTSTSNVDNRITNNESNKNSSAIAKSVAAGPTPSKKDKTGSTPSKKNKTNKGQGGSGAYKKGGSVKNTKLAAMAAPKTKITRADIITAAKKNAKKK